MIWYGHTLSSALLAVCPALLLAFGKHGVEHNAKRVHRLQSHREAGATKVLATEPPSAVEYTVEITAAKTRRNTEPEVRGGTLPR